MEQKHWLIVYDIRNPKRLAKVEKCMESFAWRIQKSVFESQADDITIGHLKHALERILAMEEDFVLFFEVCERDWQKQEKYGINSKGNDRMNDDKFIIL